MTSNAYRIGLDIGSTTAKMIVLDDEGHIVFSKYDRHQANIRSTVQTFFDELQRRLGDSKIALGVTGSVGMGLAERFGVPFTQEVVAATELVRNAYPGISTIIDIGGEDAKIVYLHSDGTSDLRMNGNCAGGTGAFIDQMAILLGVETGDLDALAARAEHIYPIASRCGVFSKTDIQNLMSKNVGKEDIAASIFHAVAVQTIVTLSHGCEVEPKILLCGGPLGFIPSLRKAFVDYLGLQPSDFVVPENAHMIPAWGTALCADARQGLPFGALTARLADTSAAGTPKQSPRLDPIFGSEEEYAAWRLRKAQKRIDSADLARHSGPAYLGIDSGSTTTKIVVTDDRDRLLFARYAPNDGNPIQAVREGLSELERACRAAGVRLEIAGSCSTGYGEDLIRAAFGLDGGIIETIAHYTAAGRIAPEVSFILDIGGQDMKAMFVENGALCRMEINEACSSGCGSFIGTFARSLDYTVGDFARAACLAPEPCDLGTRCTVFMNSKVKQALREGATVGDIAAGLSYSVVRNCLYKVLKLRHASELGDTVVVQGGTMRNDAIVRAFERLIGQEVFRSDRPELMGAYGCALHARQTARVSRAKTPDELIETAVCRTRRTQCRGCENQCLVRKYAFAGGNTYVSGNKCEKVFSNGGKARQTGYNVYAEKFTRLFDRRGTAPADAPVVGIPRCLNMYENYPFWHTLFDACGIRVTLSAPSTYKSYEAGVHSVMSDNICFPAKLVHSHIYDLAAQKVDRIFLPYVVFEKQESEKAVNSYNCPIVSGYSDVVRSAIAPDTPIDSPVITFKDTRILSRQCRAYLKTWGVDSRTASRAVKKALAEQTRHEAGLRELNLKAYEKCRAEGSLAIVLAGRPYHTDPLVQHKLSDMIAGLGVTVLSEDIVRGNGAPGLPEAHLVPQWAYINRILRAAEWVAHRDRNVHLVQMTSFGCGPDAFLTDEVRSVLNRHGKSLTLLKIDDVNNVGSFRLRVRSLIESLRFDRDRRPETRPFVTTRAFAERDRRRKIIAPFFTDYISPLLPALFRLAGYELEVLPQSDARSVEYGLRYANNEVCYPATLIVGDLVKALESGRYDPAQTAVALTQTGGQCRASNYIALIKKAMTEAGFADVPVVSLAVGSGIINNQAGLRINWFKILPIVLTTVLYSDCISKFYHASVVREKSPGDALRLREKYLSEASRTIPLNQPSALLELLASAAGEFNGILSPGPEPPRVGIVGEIFLKFNAFAHKHVVDWLIDRRIEVLPSPLTDFFMQSFVNSKVRRQTGVARHGAPDLVRQGFYTLIYRYIRRVNAVAAAFEHFTPFADIFETAEAGSRIVSLSAQFGEGWLLPAEIVSFARRGVGNVISLQPFGCIANHIVSKGIEKKIKSLYPQMNLLSLDFDSGVSDVNIANRLHLFIHNL